MVLGLRTRCGRLMMRCLGAPSLYWAYDLSLKELDDVVHANVSHQGLCDVKRPERLACQGRVLVMGCSHLLGIEETVRCRSQWMEKPST